jgi:hypothetical protein
MTRTTPRRQVDPQFWEGRRSAARSYLDAARRALAQTPPGENAVSIAGLVVTATIAYADAITARRARVVNQQDHRGVVSLLTDVLGGELSQGQARFVQRTLAGKDEVHDGIRAVRVDDARRAVEDLEAFAAWADELLR